MDFLSEFWLFMRVRKKFWLMPIFFIVVTLSQWCPSWYLQ